jgi:hypothetical protein
VIEMTTIELYNIFSGSSVGHSLDDIMYGTIGTSAAVYIMECLEGLSNVDTCLIVALHCNSHAGEKRKMKDAWVHTASPRVLLNQRSLLCVV